MKDREETTFVTNHEMLVQVLKNQEVILIQTCCRGTHSRREVCHTETAAILARVEAEG